jgi:NADH-quinone oxidoreductase subunit C
VTWLERIEQVYGVVPDSGFGPPAVDVPAREWATSLLAARDRLGCGFFDFLTAVDCLEEGFRVVAHVAALGSPGASSLLLRTNVARADPRLPCACTVYAGAAWHERETHEMFGIEVVGHDRLDPLLLPDGFEGHPLRKDFVLVSRVAKPWPGAKDPGESDADTAPSRRRTRPPGVPDPEAWPRRDS